MVDRLDPQPSVKGSMSAVCRHREEDPFCKSLSGLPTVPCRRLRTHFFKLVRQFSTTVKGTEALCATGTPMRKRLPSAVTSPPIKPGGNWNRGLGAPALNTGLALISTDVSSPSGAT